MALSFAPRTTISEDSAGSAGGIRSVAKQTGTFSSARGCQPTKCFRGIKAFVLRRIVRNWLPGILGIKRPLGSCQRFHGSYSCHEVVAYLKDEEFPFTPAG